MCIADAIRGIVGQVSLPSLSLLYLCTNFLTTWMKFSSLLFSFKIVIEHILDTIFKTVNVCAINKIIFWGHS